MRFFHYPLSITHLSAISLLKDEGCESIYLFGSLVTGDFHENSDIDLGVTGLEPSLYFRTCSKLSNILKNQFDLVDFDVNQDFLKLLKSIDEIIQIG